MKMYVSVLIAVALLPAAFLCGYIFIKDRTEKEPVGLLIGLLAAGVIICFPTALVSNWLNEVSTQIFMPFTVEMDGAHYLDGWLFDFHAAVDNFIAVALVEEGFKWIALFLITKNNKNFNSLFDGIVYAVFISLGFAGFENILYTLQFGMETALIRMVTAVPGHMFNAVIMGYYYSWYHIKVLAKESEQKLKNIGIIEKDTAEMSGTKDLIFSLLIPVLTHGFYDFCCIENYSWATSVFSAFLTFLYVFCFARIRKMSKIDTSDKKVVLALLCEKYPVVVEAVKALNNYKAEKTDGGFRENRRVTFEELCDFFEIWKQYSSDKIAADSAK